MEDEAGMSGRRCRQREARQRGGSARIPCHALQASEGWAVIQPMSRSEGSHFGTQNLTRFRKFKEWRIGQPRQSRDPCARAEKQRILGKAGASGMSDAICEIISRTSSAPAAASASNG
jgi:hypothetical protein